MMVILIIAVLGLCLGSFINVVAHRLVSKEDIVRGRSRCDHCRHQLAWYDLIPVVSFFLLAGRCRYCRKSISWVHVVSEIVCALLVLGSWFLAQQNVIGYWSLVIGHFVLYTGIVVSLWGLVIADYYYYLLPDPLMLSFLLFSLILKFLPFIYHWSFSIGHLMTDIGTGLVNAFLFILLIILSKGRGMGFGDVKLVFIIGLLLGFPLGLLAIYIAFLTGGLIAAILIIGGHKKFGQIIPFGPFLIVSTYFCLFFGNYLLIWLAQFL